VTVGKKEKEKLIEYNDVSLLVMLCVVTRKKHPLQWRQPDYPVAT